MTSTRPLTLVLVDSTVNEYQSLVQNLRSEAEVVVLDPNQDGVEQITEVLTTRNNIESLHILSHGDSGKVYLGSAQLSSETLDHYRDRLQDWHRSFTADSNILLYGCEVAAGRNGRQFVQDLSALTQASVAASTNLTGSEALGGDWELEFATGEIHAPLIFRDEAIAAYESVLGVLLEESFKNNDVTNKSFVVGSDVASNPPFLTARNSSSDPSPFPEGTIGGLPGGTVGDANGSGALRLTGPIGTTTDFDTATFVIYKQPISSSQGLSITFDYFSYGKPASSTEGGDGISFFLLDALQSDVTAGGFGGSLGYAQSGSTTGIEGGYVGIGFDEFGNFSNDTEGRVGGAGTGRVLDSIAIRGSEANQYKYLTGTGSLVGGIDSPSQTDRTLAKRTAKIDITPFVNGTGGRLSVKIDLNGDGDFVDTDEAPAALQDYDLVGNNGALPANFNFGFASSTGSAKNIHEVSTLRITTLQPGVTFSGTGVSTNPTTGAVSLTTAEGGTPTTVSVVLGAEPTGNVTLNLANGDPTEGTLSVPSLTFTPANWFTPQTFTITPVDDTLPDGGITYNIGTTFTSSDPAYSALNPADITVINTDNDGGANPPPAPVNTPPVVPTITPPEVAPGGTIAVPGLTATDPDGIGFYTIATVPPADQGTLFLGNPAQGGTPIRVGQTLTPAEIGRVFFQAGTGFTSTDFTYTATDARGATSTPRRVEFGEICRPGTPINGTNGRNRQDGQNGVNDIIFGRGGNDRIRGLSCNDVLDGGAGNDRILGGTGRDTVRGRTGNDTILGGAGADNLNGGVGNDRVTGGDGDDVLNGRRGQDLLVGGNGNDVMNGGLRNDRLRGGLGDDLVDGGRGDDFVKGGGGDDTLRGRVGRDTLVGFGGNDTLAGGLGNDLLVGSAGADRLSGNRGRDVFEYRSLQDGGDTITDFAANRDSINLSRISGGRSFGSFVRLSQSGSDTLVQVRGGSGLTLLATLTGVTASGLTANSFVL
jgi:Ca2+-binding RTX toxin-like protein